MAGYADMEPVLERRFRNLDNPKRLAAARDVICELGTRWDSAVNSVLAGHLRTVDGPALQAWLDSLPETVNSAWLRTQLLEDGPGLLHAWDRYFALHHRRDPNDLLGWARALSAAVQFEEAAQKLRLALAQEVPYAFFARAEKLVSGLAGRVRSHLRQCRIAVLGSSTTALLAQVLRALCVRDRIEVEIYEGPYGSIEQEVFDPASGLARFRPGIVLLVTHWRDLALEAVVAGEERWVRESIEARKTLWSRLSNSFQCHVVQPAFDFPAEEPYGHLAGVLRGGRIRMIELLNLRMREEAPANVSILDADAVQREAGAKRWEDEAAWLRYRQHPSAGALPVLAEAYMSHIRAVLGLTRKVLVTDLDNTLWQGVIGEDGVNGIGIGPGSPEGEAYLRLQRYLLDLKRKGTLLAVCSKNNSEDARIPFEQHPHMALRLEDFASFRANWDDKVSNLRAIASDLSLALDSFVFLDDNPLEREWVRSQLPEVAVVELGASPFSFVRDLGRGRYFHTLSLSAEDLARADQYRVEAHRESLRSSSLSLDDFLQRLQLEAAVEPVSARNLARVTQLVNKTNQFNLTTRRYTEAQVRAIADDPEGWTGAFQLSDAMGSYGLIGVIFCRPVSGAPAWEIDTWLMSCRVLGRQMEKFMLDRLVEAAIQRGIARIAGVYRPTPKNRMVQELYEQLGFRQTAGSEAETRYELEVPAQAVVTATHVHNRTAPAGVGT
jgi:FkbH-like protein